MQRQVGQRLAQDAQQTQILHQHGVRPQIGGAPRQIHRLRYLAVAHKGVHRDIHLAAADVAVAHGLGKFFFGKIVCTAARVIRAEAQINRVRPVLHRRDDGVGTSGGRKQFQHSFLDPFAAEKAGAGALFFRLGKLPVIQGTLYKTIPPVSTARRPPEGLETARIGAGKKISEKF